MHKIYMVRSLPGKLIKLLLDRVFVFPRGPSESQNLILVNFYDLLYSPENAISSDIEVLIVYSRVGIETSDGKNPDFWVLKTKFTIFGF